jgi:hypothetical protein
MLKVAIAQKKNAKYKKITPTSSNSWITFCFILVIWTFSALIQPCLFFVRRALPPLWYLSPSEGISRNN